MIEIRKLRKRVEGLPPSKDNLIDLPFSPKITCLNVLDLFQNLQSLLDQIPDQEKYDCHYTLCSTAGGERRSFVSQECLAFDIDGIGVNEHGEYEKAYEDIVLHILGSDRSNTAIVFSGNGLHFILPTKTKLVQTDFERQRTLYAGCCDLIDEALAENNLKGTCDRGIFAPNHMLRLPGTWNKKPGKADRLAVLVNSPTKKWTGSLSKVSGIPLLEAKDVYTEEQGSKADSKTILAECEFLKSCASSPQNVTEPLWYAMASIVGRFENGSKIFHQMSSGHPGYKEHEANKKLQAALKSAGPRTCKNIDSLWGGCASCKHFQKVPSPISIKDENFIATEDSGFAVVSDKGGVRYQYEDLRKYFEKEHPYTTNAGSGQVYVFNKTHFSPWTGLELSNYAANKFRPDPPEKDVNEWIGRVKRKRVHKDNWQIETTIGKANLLNGVLDFATGELRPHSSEMGFMHVLPYEYDPLSVAPAFLEFLDSFTKGDKEVQKYLLEFIGYTLIDTHYAFQTIPILFGEGANGKSTFLSFVEAVVGKANCSHLSMNQLSSDRGVPALEGKLLNICDEIPNTSRHDTEFLKKITGGMGNTSGRRLFQDVQNFFVYAKLLFSCNNLPTFRDDSIGFFRRVRFIPCNNYFPEGTARNRKELFAEIEVELPGIFNLAVEAYRKAQKINRLTTPKVCEQINDRLRGVVDPTTKFIKDMLLEDPSSKTNLSAVYSNYEADLDSHGFEGWDNKKVNLLVFIDKLKKNYPEVKINTVVQTGRRVYLAEGLKYRGGDAF